MAFAMGLLIFAMIPRVQAGNGAQIGFLSSSQSASVGATVNFFVSATGDPTLLYQWSFDGVPIPGATSQILTLANVQTTNQGSYQVVVTNDFGSSTSAVTMLMVVLTPAVSGWSASTSVTQGAPAFFSVSTTGQPPITFQWNFDGAAIPGATSASLTIPSAQTSNSGSYQVFVTNAYGHASSPVLPLSVTLPPVVNSATGSGPAVIGGTATFTAIVQGVAPLLYQWYFETASSSNALLNATNSTLSVTNVQATNAGSYQLFVTNTYGNTQSVPLPLQIVPGTAPGIGAQPVSQTVPQGFLASFQILVSGTAPLFYQWWFDGNPVSSATNAALSIYNVQPGNAGSYQVVVTNAFGGKTSKVVTLSVPMTGAQAEGVVLAPLFSFDAATNGSLPDSSLIYGSDGDLYVTTSAGGTNDVSTGGDGTISKMDTNGNVLWTVSLTQAGGANPAAGLAPGGGGVFYGTAFNGGAGFGTVFKITSDGTLTSLYSFTNGLDGANPQAALTLGSDGYLYGSTIHGGTNDAGSGGDGTLFKMTTNGVLVWTFSLNKSDGQRPVSALVQTSNGILYGTSGSGGTNNVAVGGSGTVFAITTNGIFTSLYSFTGGTDGAYPQAGLAVGPDGGLYGTTTAGGNLALNAGFGFGTVFDITTNGSLTTLDTFNGTNGISSEGTLTLGSDDNFYGTTLRGGADYPTGYGTLFRVTINGGITSLFSFNGGGNGAFPAAGLTQVNPGVFYGTTSQGGTNDLDHGGDGSVFRFSGPPGPLALGNVGNQVLQVGQYFIVTNQAFGGTEPITLSLPASDPAGAGLTAAGAFYWTPACTEGNSTNQITIWAIDSSTPPASNAMTFTVIVGQCVQVSIGSGSVQIGGNTCVPVNLLSTVSLTNLSFSISTTDSRLVNWTVNPADTNIGAATVRGPLSSLPQFNFAAQSGDVLTGSSLLGYVRVDVLNSGHSGDAALAVSGIVATSSAGTLAGPVFGQDGQLVLLQGHPSLEVASSPAGLPPLLTLYGNPGSTYFIQYTTDPTPPISWKPLTNFSLTGFSTHFNPAFPGDLMEIFSAYSMPPEE